METASGPSLPRPQHWHPGPGAGSGAPWMCPDSAGTVESRTPGQAQSRARGVGASLPRGPALTRRSWEQVHKLDRIRATEETSGVDALLTPSREDDTHGGRGRRGRGWGGGQHRPSPERMTLTEAEGGGGGVGRRAAQAQPRIRRSPRGGPRQGHSHPSRVGSACGGRRLTEVHLPPSRSLGPSLLKAGSRGRKLNEIREHHIPGTDGAWFHRKARATGPVDV